MKTASRRFSTIPGFKSLQDIFFKWVPVPIEGFAQVPTELTFEAFYVF